MCITSQLPEDSPVDFDILSSPAAYLQEQNGPSKHARELAEYEAWWRSEGSAISDAVDRSGSPWLRMFDKNGARVDEILYQPDYWRMLRKGYESGVIWRAFETMSLVPFYELLYLVSFYDPGLACPYTVSMSTALPIWKYGDGSLKQDVLAKMLRKDGTAWQGATWMTEIKGGSDLGAAVETVARRDGDRWLLTGDKYFASNAGAEVSVTAARIEGAPRTVRGLGLFVVPRRRETGELNYFIRRIKDKIATRSVPTGEIELRESEGYLLGEEQAGIYLILEVLNVSRVANSIGSTALAQRAIADAMDYARTRTAFGKPIIEHPLLAAQFRERVSGLRSSFALAWQAARLLNEVWQEKPPYSDRYHLFRLVAHLAKYWSAEFAAQTAKWAMEVHGGIGTLQEFGADRWLRESMILAIWEGTSHRQILDGLEVMERKAAHVALLEMLAPHTTAAALEQMRSRIERVLALSSDEKQVSAEKLFQELAIFTGAVLSRQAEAHKERGEAA
jgi:alkylation response protein AidB-like acyl-CoA dehydrogenase